MIPTADRSKPPRTVRLLLLCAVLAAGGCSEEICPPGAPAVYQESPSGRAVAYVDNELFGAVLSWLEQDALNPQTSFNCLIDFYTNRYATDVDMLFVVLDIARNDFLQESERKIITNFTASQRLLESGIGTLPGTVLFPVGPPSMRSYSFFGAREGLLAGPSLHEIAHGWCAYVDGPEVLARQLARQPSSHWGFSSVGGVLGGWSPDSLEILGADRFRACGPAQVERFAPQGYANNIIPYAPLELYLMGLIGPEEVPPIEVAVNPAVADSDSQCTTFYADAIETVTIDDIIAANGPRVPDAQDSQKHFTVALILIAEDPLTDSDWAYYEQAMTCLESTEPCDVQVSLVTSQHQLVQFTPLSFFEATGGRGSLRFATVADVSDARTSF